jgi:peptidoglycan/LPS O-acetylase OafA/YrhL
MTTPHPQQGGRLYGLDILRAAAILTVVYAHGYPYLMAYVPRRAYRLFALDGVTMFFVLSGYLIGGILLRTLAGAEFGAREAGSTRPARRELTYVAVPRAHIRYTIGLNVGKERL